jgi:hypothetical protein
MQIDQLQVSEDDWADWLLHPITKVFREYMRKSRLDLMEQWAQGCFTNQEHFATAVANAAAIGQADLFKRLLDLDHTTVNEGMSDE